MPLTVTVSDVDYRDGIDLGCEQLAARLVAGERASTAQPSPGSFAQAYAAAAELGADEVVSLHLSGELSGTVHAAALAARDAPIPVHVVDTGTTGAALGAAVEVASTSADAGHSALEVARLAVAVARASSTMFVVESPDHLRRGGRWGRAASAVGTVLGVRPILVLREGRIELLQLVRSRPSAWRRLVRGAVEHSAGMVDPQVFVHFFDDEESAGLLAADVGEATGGAPDIVQAGAVLGAHVGPGMLGVVVIDRAAAQ